MNVELDNGKRFMANLRYNIKPEISKDPNETIKTQGLG
jgi:hypothetical protein